MASSPEFVRHNGIEEWFCHRGVALINESTGYEAHKTEWLIAHGILECRNRHLATNVVTSKFLGHHREIGDGWYVGGAQSYFRVLEVVYDCNNKKNRKLIAFKAVHSMGDIQTKTLTEAAWMAQVSAFGRCGRVYAVSPGMIVKEFFEEDESTLSLDLQFRLHEEQIIVNLLARFGLKLAGGRKFETVQHNGHIKLIDLGTGDLDGPSIYQFIDKHPISQTLSIT